MYLKGVPFSIVSGSLTMHSRVLTRHVENRRRDSRTRHKSQACSQQSRRPSHDIRLLLRSAPPLWRSMRIHHEPLISSFPTVVTHQEQTHTATSS